MECAIRAQILHFFKVYILSIFGNALLVDSTSVEVTQIGLLRCQFVWNAPQRLNTTFLETISVDRLHLASTTDTPCPSPPAFRLASLSEMSNAAAGAAAVKMGLFNTYNLSTFSL